MPDPIFLIRTILNTTLFPQTPESSETHFVLNNVSDISHKPILINFSDFALLKFERYLYIRCAGPPLKANEYNLFFTKEILIH